MNQKALHTLEYDKIIHLLEECAQTAAGRRLCAHLLPMDDIDDIREAQRATSDARRRVELNGNLSLGGARDVSGPLARLKVGSSLNGAELLDIASVLDTAAAAKAWGRQEDDAEDDSLSVRFRMLEGAPALSREIRRCLPAADEVADDASPALKSVRRQLAGSEERIHEQLNRVLNASRDLLQDPVVTIRNGRYCLPVKAEFKGHFQGMVHDQSASGSTYFIEPISVVRLNNEIRELQLKEKQEVDIILAKLSALAADEQDIIKTDSEVMTELDFIFAKARFANSLRASEPSFDGSRALQLKRARHPLLDKKTVVPVDIALGKDYDLLVVTGPNTGGKTVSLKTVGLLSLMGQAGMHIPADEGSSLGFFHEVFADIGDEQSIEQSLSTFSAHMTNIASILQTADEDSLCLFDELGAGTDPTEGAALAMAILDHLHMYGIRTMATTHYSELKVYALQMPGVENASCEFDVATLRPTYRLLTGVPGKSNAFAIAGKLGIESDIIEEARGYLSHGQLAFEDVIADLEDTKSMLEREKNDAERYRLEAEQLRARQAKSEQDLASRREQLVEEAQDEARQVVAEAKAFVDETIRQVRAVTDDREVLRSLERERSKLNERLKYADSQAAGRRERRRKKHQPEQAEREASRENLLPGTPVHVKSMGLDGTVSSAPNERGELFVQIGSLRTKVKIADLSLAEAQPEEPASGRKSAGAKSAYTSIGMGKAADVPGEVNLIGKTTDEALPMLDKYLDDAYLGRKESVRVIHGRGTGALKKMVQQFLRKDPRVESYRRGEFGEGGDGVTVVVFKK